MEFDLTASAISLTFRQNPFAWIYRGLVVNEVRSGAWDDPGRMLQNIGFVGVHGKPFGMVWVGYAFAYAIPYSLLCTVLTALGLTFVRNKGGRASSDDRPSDSNRQQSCFSVEHGSAIVEAPSSIEIEIPFQPVTLSFKDICYTVTASTSKDELKLLTNVNGIFRPGRMCALMGTSGAGKTTLMVRLSFFYGCAVLRVHFVN